jgi:hypothetical protein
MRGYYEHMMVSRMIFGPILFYNRPIHHVYAADACQYADSILYHRPARTDKYPPDPGPLSCLEFLRGNIIVG